jgi:2-polyprenyl-3-methyl-5-hydroxy-6-metoxy-1,4-benzoquinol methylase
MKVGIQENGSSNYFTKKMALSAINATGLLTNDLTAIDIGAGEGELTTILSPIFKDIIMLDVYKAQALSENTQFIYADLNKDWDIPRKVNFAFSLEVIEHIENPRHFFRQVNSVLNSNGYLFLTTPNNHTIYSKLTFLIKGEHRYFQDPSYPAHITALTKKDFIRIAEETGFKIVKWFYSDEDMLPIIHFRVRLPGKLFSQSIGVLLKKD